MIGYSAKRFANIDAVSWEQCFVTNGTYLDCPLVNYKNGNISFIAAVHNPTMDYANYARIKVPHDKYTAQGWNEETMKWEPIRSEIFCSPVKFVNGMTVNDCNMHIEYLMFPT